MPLELLKPGDKVKLNDAGIKVAGDFCTSREDAERMMGTLLVEDAVCVEVTDEAGVVENFQSVGLAGWEALFDNTQMEKV